jgi:hypothetical protein
MRTPAANVRGVAGVGCRAVSSWPRSEGRLFVTLSGVQARRTRGGRGGRLRRAPSWRPATASDTGAAPQTETLQVFRKRCRRSRNAGLRPQRCLT